MKAKDIIQEFGGRVVPGVNTTPDVGPDAIKKQVLPAGDGQRRLSHIWFQEKLKVKNPM